MHLRSHGMALAMAIVCYGKSVTPLQKTTKPGWGVLVKAKHCKAEGVGFEPTVRQALQRFSRPSRSAAPAPLRKNQRFKALIFPDVDWQRTAALPAGPLRSESRQ